MIKRLKERGLVTIIGNGTDINVIGTGEMTLPEVFDSGSNDPKTTGEMPLTSTGQMTLQERYRERYKEREETPTLDDVISYCRQMSFTFSPDRFFNYYEALGWQKNGQPIMNWKAVARNWQSRERVQPVQEEVEKDDWGRPIPPKYV